MVLGFDSSTGGAHGWCQRLIPQCGVVLRFTHIDSWCCDTARAKEEAIGELLVLGVSRGAAGKAFLKLDHESSAALKTMFLPIGPEIDIMHCWTYQLHPYPGLV